MGGVGLKGRSLLLPLTFVIVVALDQFAKALVRTRLPIGEPVPLIPHVMWLTHIGNTGGAFSILAGRQWVFMLAASSVLVAVIALWVFARPTRVQALGLGLVAGGASGNLIDRFAYGQVTDYLDVRWWPVFNVADIAIVLGVCLLAAWILLAHRDASQEASGDGDADGGDGGGQRPREDS